MDRGTSLAVWLDAFVKATKPEGPVRHALGDLARNLENTGARDRDAMLMVYLYGDHATPLGISDAMARHAAVAVADGLGARLSGQPGKMQSMPHVPAHPKDVPMERFEAWRAQGERALQEGATGARSVLAACPSLRSWHDPGVAKAFAACFARYGAYWRQGWAFGALAAKRPSATGMRSPAG